MKYSLTLILIILLTIPTLAADKTPYPHIFGGNSYSGARNASVTWLAERYDMGIAGLTDWPDMFDSIWDTSNSWGSQFLCGPYASSQELNMHNSAWIDSSYAARLLNLDLFWLVSYAEHYMDSIGTDIESLYVHLDEDTINITNDATMGYLLTALIYQQWRFSYQIWSNTPSETVMYPAGFAWLANGFNEDTRDAIAYAYRRHLIEDSATYGRGGDAMWTVFFMDNQFRKTTAPRLPTYYTINYTQGGPTAYMDWIEAGQIENDGDTLLHYYDNSTMAIDSILIRTLDSTADDNSLPDSIRAFANLDNLFNSTHFSRQIKVVNGVFENPLDYGLTWAAYTHFLICSDTMGNRNSGGADQRYLLWMHLVDFLVNESTWRTMDRMFMAHYAFHMNMYHSNIYVGMHRFNDSTRWRKIAEVDGGSDFQTRTLTNEDGVGNYGNRSFVMNRKVVSDGGDTTLWLFRSGTGKNCYFMADTCANDSSQCPGGLGSACDSTVSYGDAIHDSILVSLGNDYYAIDVDADTALTTVSSKYLHIYEGWCGTLGSGGTPDSPPDAGTVYEGSDYEGVDLR